MCMCVRVEQTAVCLHIVLNIRFIEHVYIYRCIVSVTAGDGRAVSAWV